MPDWLLPSTVAALAVVLAEVGRRILTRLDALDEMMRTELRGMDVRISRIEEHLWPRK
jgi:hypothetical protein